MGGTRDGGVKQRAHLINVLNQKVCKLRTMQEVLQCLASSTINGNAVSTVIVFMSLHT